METGNESVTFVCLFYFLAIYKYIYKISNMYKVRKYREAYAYVKDYLPTTLQFGIFIEGHIILKS